MTNTRPIWILILVSACTTDAYSATYYVDANGGNNSSSGTSETQAWQTLAKVNAHPFIPGDNILLRRGCQWRETLAVVRSGTTTNSLLFGAYGQGPLPIINGANPTSTWTLYDSQHHWWSTHVPWTPTPASPSLDVVYFNGQRGIKRHSLAAVVAAQQWYWNSATQTLYVYSLEAPAGIETAARDYGILGRDAFNLLYIIIQDVEIKQTNSKSVLIGAGNHHWTLRNLVAHHNGRCDDIEDAGNGNDRVGISVRRCNYTLITGCLIYESGENSVQVTGGSNNIVEKCTIYNPHHHAIDFKGISIFVCRDNTIRYNRIYGTPDFTADVNGIAIINEAGMADFLNTNIHHNVIYDIPDSGIVVFGNNVYNTQILNNTLLNCRSHNIHLLNGTCTTTLKNNIAITASSGWCPTLKMESATGKTIDYNCWRNTPIGTDLIQINTTDYRSLAAYQAATGLDTHSLSGPPLFQDETGRDFHLANDSPCINTGTPVGLYSDIEGSPIPHDAEIAMGAYQSTNPSGSPLTIIQQPHGARKCLTQTHTFFVSASGGSGEITYQWHKDGQPIAAARQPAFTTQPLAESDSGYYTVAVTDEDGAMLTSAPAFLEVGPFTMPTVTPIGMMLLVSIMVSFLPLIFRD